MTDEELRQIRERCEEANRFKTADVPASFIAHFRTDILRLLNEIERLKSNTGTTNFCPNCETTMWKYQQLRIVLTKIYETTSEYTIVKLIKEALGEK